jgi:hypothetical protein
VIRAAAETVRNTAVQCSPRSRESKVKTTTSPLDRAVTRARPRRVDCTSASTSRPNRETMGA